MKRNVAGQKIGAQMVSATDGSAFTSAVTVYVTGDAGTQAVGSVGAGACAHEGNGYHTYAPAQAETDYDLAAFTFIGTGAVPATVQVATGFPQTGDNFALLGTPAGASIAADIATRAATGAAMTLTSGERNSVADALLDRDMATGTDSGGRTVRNALRFLRNKWSLDAGTGLLTVYKENDSTPAWTGAVTSDAAQGPVVGNDPA